MHCGLLHFSFIFSPQSIRFHNIAMLFSHTMCWVISIAVALAVTETDTVLLIISIFYLNCGVACGFLQFCFIVTLTHSLIVPIENYIYQTNSFVFSQTHTIDYVIKHFEANIIHMHCFRALEMSFISSHHQLQFTFFWMLLITQLNSLFAKKKLDLFELFLSQYFAICFGIVKNMTWQSKTNFSKNSPFHRKHLNCT